MTSKQDLKADRESGWDVVYQFVLLPGMLGTCISFILGGATYLVAMGIILGSMTMLMMWLRFQKQVKAGDRTAGGWYGSAFSRLTIGALLGFVALMSGQTYFTEGRNAGVLVALSHGTICGLIYMVPSQFRRDFGSGFVQVVASTVGMMCAVNLLASYLGLSTTLTDREGFSFSYYGEDRWRWQSPLLSSWQLSGLGRWALPVLCCGLLYRRTSRLGLACGALWLPVLAATLVFLEYRAALMPLLGFLAWLAAWTRGLRIVLVLGALLHFVAAPFLFGSDVFLRLLEGIVPDALVRLSGATLTNILTLSDRTEIWLPGIDYLMAGKHLVFGQGIVGLDATDIAAWDLSKYHGLIPKISFHQGFLDLVYMFGVIPGTALVAGIGLWSVRFMVVSALSSENVHGTFGSVDADVAVVSLMAVATSNSHDGFFNGHLIFFVVVFACCNCLRLPAPREERVKAGKVRLVRDEIRAQLA